MSVHFPDPGPPDFVRMDAELRRMSGTLSCDFANGRVGERHNTYQHRARLISQLTARRDRLQRALAEPALGA